MSVHIKLNVILLSGYYQSGTLFNEKKQFRAKRWVRIRTTLKVHGVQKRLEIINLLLLWLYITLKAMGYQLFSLIMEHFDI